MSFEYARKPDLPSRTNKPLKKTCAHAAKNPYGSSYFFPVIQRVKINGKDVDFVDPAERGLIKSALQDNPIFKYRIMDRFFTERNQQEVADELILSVADVLTNDGKECKDYNGVAYEVASLGLKRLSDEEKERNRRSYKIGDRLMMFDESDRLAIERDPLFADIRGEQKKTRNIVETIQMPKLQYSDFYSRRAMRDEVTRWLISQGARSDRGSGRTPPMYRVDFQQDEEDDISLKRAYGSSTLHHIRPLSVITKEYEGDRSDKQGLQRHEWNADNLVLGPDRNRRIYEPGDATDFEARWVYRRSNVVVGAHDVQKEELQPIKRETDNAAMRTDYLQYFYSTCLQYIKCMDPTKPELRTETPRNLVELAQLMRSRFAMIEIRHSNAGLIEKLKNLINTFINFSEGSTERMEEVINMVHFLIEYGKYEDAEI